MVNPFYGKVHDTLLENSEIIAKILYRQSLCCSAFLVKNALTRNCCLVSVKCGNAEVGLVKILELGLCTRFLPERGCAYRAVDLGGDWEDIGRS